MYSIRFERDGKITKSIDPHKRTGNRYGIFLFDKVFSR